MGGGGLRGGRGPEPVSVVGSPGPDDLDAVGELAATLGAYAVGLMD